MKTLFVLITSLVTLNLNAATIGPVELDAAGKLLEMNFGDATTYCASKGLRLPTIREFAELGKSMGAEIKENCEQTQHDPLQVCIAYNDTSGSKQFFTYLPSKYRAPSDKDYWGRFWSSSKCADGCSGFGKADTYTFHGSNGWAWVGVDSEWDLGVRCAQD